MRKRPLNRIRRRRGYQVKTIDELGILISSHNYRYSNEKDLQMALEALFKKHNVTFKREVHLSPKDIIDFVVEIESHKVGLEIKIDGTQNALLRQLNRYISYEELTAVFVVGSPFWINSLPGELSQKTIYRHRILTGIF